MVSRNVHYARSNEFSKITSFKYLACYLCNGKHVEGFKVGNWRQKRREEGYRDHGLSKKKNLSVNYYKNNFKTLLKIIRKLYIETIMLEKKKEI